MTKSNVFECPACGSALVQVFNSRNRETSGIKYRQRECLECGHRYSSYELLAEEYNALVKDSEELRKIRSSWNEILQSL